MKKFSFSLEKVLKLREFYEQQEKLELGKAVSEVNRIQAQLEDVAQKRVFATKSRSKATFDELFYLENFINRLDLKKEELLTELTQAEMVAEEKRKVFEVAMRNRKVISKVKEKQLEEYKKESNMAEDNVLDDIANRPKN